MKIILCADVENLGKLGDVVTVRAGYGRNYLLPQGLAMVASAGNLKLFELERKKLVARMDQIRSEAADTKTRLEALEVIIPMHVGENEKLYGSVTSTIIGDALAALGVEVDRRRILMDAPIRTLGEHPVRVRLHSDVVALVPVKVVSDHQPQPESEEDAPASPPESEEGFLAAQPQEEEVAISQE
ncbi:MAG: 50S ribosomal protein L9 [Desulfovibrio sp.]|jgi:large subunit ribosomal protein L9|nr:50S ribosomal protein L9 [Desulfovibrio sp.]